MKKLNLSLKIWIISLDMFLELIANKAEEKIKNEIDIINKHSKAPSIPPRFGCFKEGKWLEDNSYKFGFILRYPKGKENKTGYNYEPWHFRYVGIAAAKQIKSSGIVLEEYLRKK